MSPTRRNCLKQYGSQILSGMIGAGVLSEMLADTDGLVSMSNAQSLSRLSPQTWSTQTSRAPELVTDQAQNAIQLGLEYLASQQHPDGTFGNGIYRENPGVNALVGMAFLAAGESLGRRGPYEMELHRVFDWMLNRVQNNALADSSDATRGPMYSLGYATLFLAECYGMIESSTLGAVLRNAVKWILAAQNSEGGWRYQMQPVDADISVTSCQVMALRAAKNTGIYVPKEAIEKAIVYIRSCQNPDGGFAYMRSQGGVSAFARSAAALAGLYSCGIYQDPVINRAIQYIMQFCPDGTEQKVQAYYYYGHYYAAIAFWQTGGETWKKWFPAVRDELIRSQRKKMIDGKQVGLWEDSGISPEFAVASSLLVLQTPYEQIPIFQR
ncbi:MAG: terpene cyclase/mutase family protein [Thermoguttaceae bacterium]|nr:terpene cyclase/mutase family protein [Thermoguttaceae bacterium]